MDIQKPSCSHLRAFLAFDFYDVAHLKTAFIRGRHHLMYLTQDKANIPI